MTSIYNDEICYNIGERQQLQIENLVQHKKNKERTFLLFFILCDLECI
jgi:hypothetical protein